MSITSTRKRPHPPRTTARRPAAPSRSRQTPAPKQKKAPASPPPAAGADSEAPTGRIWDSPTTSYYLLVSATILLLALGLVMVLSASTVYSLRDTGGRTPLSGFFSQAKYALMAIPVAVVIAHLPLKWLKALVWPAMLGSLGLLGLGLIPAFRVAAGGNEAWIVIAGQSLQPGEIAKLGLALWLGLMLGNKQHQLDKVSHVVFPAGVGILLVLAGVLHTKDLGTALIYFILVAGAMWVAGVPAMMFAVTGMVAVAVVTAFTITSGNRMTRILQFLGKGEHDPLGLDLQPVRALQGLGTGGWSGVGLGASRAKWLYLPEAHNDYIFAIIGEELGLLGTLVVLALFLALAVGMTRVVKRHPDPFVKIATGGIGAWILGQAAINIGVTINLLPVIGVPLPLISAGGSSLITTLFALAFVIAFARSEPGCAEALASRRFRFRRSLAVLAPGRGRGR